MNKLHCGAGPIHLNGWLNFDLDKGHEHCEQHGDVLQTHFDDNSFEVIYSCHFFEHLSFPIDAVECLNRFYKWLKPNGVIRMAVPDLKLAVNAYMTTGDLSFLYGVGFKGYYYKDCKADRLNFFIKAWEHKCCYDYELLSSMFADAGFKNIQKKQANETLIPNFNYDRFISESLYIEAQK